VAKAAPIHADLQQGEPATPKILEVPLVASCVAVLSPAGHIEGHWRTDPLPDNLVIGSSQSKDGSAGTHELSHPATALSRYAAGMTLGLTLLQTEVHRELPIPAWAFGVLAFGILTVLLLITWSIGKGRPHS
jgi:hypothetical protein